MSDLEQNLRDMLAARAGTSTPPPGDWQDLTIRMARRNRRAKRLMAAGLVVVLLVGPLAGFAVARAVEDSEPSNRVTAGAPSDVASNGEIGAIADARIAIGSYGLGIPLEKLFRRTAGDITIRAFIGRFGHVGSMCQGDGWCPPADCYSDGVVVGQLSTDAAVGIANGEHYAEVTDDLKLTGSGVFGADGEGSPARWVIAQVSDNVAKVRVSFEGGGSDEMAPVDGVVLLAALTDTTKVGGTVEALDESGSVLGKVDASSPVIMAWDSTAVLRVDGSSWSDVTTTTVVGATATTVPAPDARATETERAAPPTISPNAPDSSVSSPPGINAKCAPPPPTLPAPGEQPENAATAKAEVEQAFATAYSGGLGNDEAKRAVVEDSESLEDVMAQVRSGSFADQVNSASAVVHEVVFTSPTEAAVRYDILVAGANNFPGRIGKALFLDGRWKIARVTICADISLAGVTCPVK